MKTCIILLLCGVAIFGVVKVLGSTLSPPEYKGDVTNVNGSLGVGAVSVAGMDTAIWREPRPTSTRADRARMRVGDLKEGETFVVLKHVRRGAPLWVLVRCQDRDIEGWIVSPPATPFMASRLNSR